MLPLRPDPDADREAHVASLTRAAIACGMSVLDNSRNPLRIAAKSWPKDEGVALILRASTAPLTTDQATALWNIATAYLEVLRPQSAARRDPPRSPSGL